LFAVGATSAFAQSGATGLITLENVVCPTSYSYEGSFDAYWEVNDTAANNVGVFVWTVTTGYVLFASGRDSEASGDWLTYDTYYAFELLSELDANYDYSSGYYLWQADQQC
jgi:hypothetical protein